jgi:hypothetical protein
MKRKTKYTHSQSGKPLAVLIITKIQVGRARKFNMSEWLLSYAKCVFSSYMLIVLTHGNNNPCIDMSPYSETLAWFRANQSLFCLLYPGCLAEKQHIEIAIPFGLIRSRREPRIYSTRGEHANQYTTECLVLNRNTTFSYIGSSKDYTIIQLS